MSAEAANARLAGLLARTALGDRAAFAAAAVVVVFYGVYGYFVE